MTSDIIGAALLTAGTLLAIRALSRAPRSRVVDHGELLELLVLDGTLSRTVAAALVAANENGGRNAS